MLGGLWRKFLGGRGGKQQPCRADLEVTSGVQESELDALSNRANDLIERRQWEQAIRVCEELRTRFPEELDADDRLAQLYEALGQPAKALPYAEAALKIARGDPEKFDPDLAADLQERVTSLSGPQSGKRPQECRS